MKFSLSPLLLISALCLPVYAQNDVYVCINDNGGREYRNTGLTKGCKRMDVPSGTIIAAPVTRKPTGAPVLNGGPEANNRKNTPASADAGAQKARDVDRRQILGDELRAEEQKLAELKRDYNNGEPERRGDERNYAKYQERVQGLKEAIARAEKNMDALKREIGK